MLHQERDLRLTLIHALHLLIVIMLASAFTQSLVRSNALRRAIPAVQISVARSYSNRSNYQQSQQNQSTRRCMTAAAVVAATAVAASVAITESSCDAKSSDKFAKTAMFPKIEAYQKGLLKVSDIHSIAYSVYGNPKGKPVLVVHGGPGGGTTPGMYTKQNKFI
jgi:hypothetical protein